MLISITCVTLLKQCWERRGKLHLAETEPQVGKEKKAAVVAPLQMLTCCKAGALTSIQIRCSFGDYAFEAGHLQL